MVVVVTIMVVVVVIIIVIIVVILKGQDFLKNHSWISNYCRLKQGLYFGFEVLLAFNVYGPINGKSVKETNWNIENYAVFVEEFVQQEFGKNMFAGLS